MLDLDACAYEPAPGQRLRLSVAGADWPNTVAPPAPVTLTVHEGALELPLWRGPGTHSRVVHPRRRDQQRGPRRHLVDDPARRARRRRPPAAVRHGSTYEVPHDGTATERYAGEVTVDRTHLRPAGASAECSFVLGWPGGRGAGALDDARRHRRRRLRRVDRAHAHEDGVAGGAAALGRARPRADRRAAASQVSNAPECGRPARSPSTSCITASSLGANGPGRKCGLARPRCTDSQAAQSCRLVRSQNSTAPGAATAAVLARPGQPRALDPGAVGGERHQPVGHHVVGVRGDQQVRQQVEVLDPRRVDARQRRPAGSPVSDIVAMPSRRSIEPPTQAPGRS